MDVVVVLVVVTVGYYKWGLSSCNGCSGSISSSDYYKLCLSSSSD